MAVVTNSVVAGVLEESNAGCVVVRAFQIIESQLPSNAQPLMSKSFLGGGGIRGAAILVNPIFSKA